MDTLILIVFALYFFAGWRKGFLKSLSGPVSLILGIILAYYYYFQEKNLLMAVVVSIAGPVVINLALSFIINMFKRNDAKKNKPSMPSSMAGGLLSVSWSGTLFLLTLIVITMIPIKLPWIQKAQHLITTSKTYAFIKSVVGEEKVVSAKDIEEISETMKDPEVQKEMQTNEHYQKVIKNDKIKDILNEEALIKAVENQDLEEIQKFATDPRFIELMQDKELIANIFAMHQDAMKIKNKQASP